MFFLAEIELQKYNYDVISVTSSPLHHKNVYNLGPPIKIYGYASG